jgi:hypothetical protein
MKNMRSISLYEVIRKVWTTTIAKRIHRVLHGAGVLYSAQSGYRLDQGTMMSLLQMINQIEAAIHSDTSKHITFWDIRRAFDSISRNLQKLAWMRMGVSKGVAEWFIQLGDGGLSFIDTPLYANTSNLHSHKDMLKGKSTSCVVPKISNNCPLKLALQRKSASSLQWTVLYDMVLEWIDPRNKKLYKDENLQEYNDTKAKDTAPYAYADDLATSSAGPQAKCMQQLQEKWLSAFCIFSGLTIHSGKIKATIVGNKIDQRHDPRTKPDGTKYCSYTLTVYDHQWAPTECSIDPTLTAYKYLGVHLDLCRKNTDTFDRQRIKAAAMLSHLLTQAGSPQAKIDYIQFEIMPIIL